MILVWKIDVVEVEETDIMYIGELSSSVCVFDL